MVGVLEKIDVETHFVLVENFVDLSKSSSGSVQLQIQHTPRS
jgi:hypothetical protein